MTEIRKITLQFPSLRAFLAEYGERISADGMLLRGEALPAAGSSVDIEVVVAEGMRLLRVWGETLWSGAGGAGGGPQEAAVRFQELDPASRTVIDRIVEQRQREGAEPFSLEDFPGPREARLRDLTVPAAVSPGESAAADAAGDSIFDLEQPPETATADLFSSVGVGEATSPPAVEAPARDRQPAPPVPLLADPDPGPFDLVPETAAGGEEVAAADLELEPAPHPRGGPEAQAHPDLSELFSGDEPGRAPARGRTEAFPPSFVDEVEAELEAADTPDEPESSYLLVDTGELEVRLGTPIDEPDEGTGEAEVTVVVPEAPSEVVPETEPVVEAEGVGEPEQTVEEQVVVPEAPSEPVPETEPVVEAEAEAAAVREKAPDPEAAQPETALDVDRAFAAEQGPETVEIPILAKPAPAVEPAPAEPPSPLETPAPAVVAPPPIAEPVPTLDDNLLSIPELKQAAGEAEAPVAVEEVEDLPSSAQSLRGAASSSRHVGTWLLIALLLGALGVAGYFLMGLMRGEDAVSETGSPAPVTAPGPVVPTPAPEAQPPAMAGADGSETVEEPASETAVAAQEQTAAAVEVVPAEPEATEPEATVPTAPFTGLDRITWNETEAETVLALVGNGAIPREQVELVTLTGAQPRLVIKIAGVDRAFQPSVLEVGTSQVQRVRTGLQAGGELHVVVDLSGSGVSMLDLATRGSRLEVRLGAE